MGPWNEWFDPFEGRAAISALIDVITTKAGAAKLLENPNATVEELTELMRVLEIAAENEVKFRLQMS